MCCGTLRWLCFSVVLSCNVSCCRATRADARGGSVYKQLMPQPPKTDVPELFETYTKFIKLRENTCALGSALASATARPKEQPKEATEEKKKEKRKSGSQSGGGRESQLLLHDNAGSGRTEAVKLFLFNTCLLLCRRALKPGKWDLRVLMRMNKAIRYEERGQLQFAVTAKGRTFKFGAMERGEVRAWLQAFEKAVRDKREPPKLQADDGQLGGLLDGLKAGLSFADDDDDLGEYGKPSSASNSSSRSASRASNASAPRAPSDDEADANGANNDDDDDDPFAAIAKRPSAGGAAKSSAPAAGNSGGGGDLLSLFDAPAPGAQQAPAPQQQQNPANSFDDFFGNQAPPQQQQQQQQQQFDFFGGGGGNAPQPQQTPQFQQQAAAPAQPLTTTGARAAVAR